MVNQSFSDLLRRPVVVAPMAGGPSTPELVVEAARGGAVGFLAAGYKTAAAMRSEMEVVRVATAEAFGVNVFVPGAPTADKSSLSTYVERLHPVADSLGTTVGRPAWDDDDWQQKVDNLLADPPPIVSFTFGCPERELVSSFCAGGTSVWVTVTNPDEAVKATLAGASCLCVQGHEAGAHRGTFANEIRSVREWRLPVLIKEVKGVTDLPLIAAGGIVDNGGLRMALNAGAVGIQCGTAFLRCPESGASEVHKAALASGRFTTTAVTRAFSGRPARGLVNQFMLEHQDAPAAYPEVNNATRPLRAAAAANGDMEQMSLWAGTGFRGAMALPAAEIVEMLCRP